MKSLLVAAVAFAGFALTSPAFAHNGHCHEKDEAGNLVDTKKKYSEAECETKNLFWVHHHSSCYEVSKGKKIAHKTIKTEKTCTAKGFEWTGHAPEKHAD